MGRPDCGADLSTRADTVDLPAVATPADGNVSGIPVDLLDAESDRDAWRVVEVFTHASLPFDIELRWSAGSGSGARAQITVARSARVCVRARTVTVRATNLGRATNRVGVTIADGFAVTSNHFEVRGDATDADGSPIVPVPPFATHVRVDVADPAALDTHVDLVAGNDRVYASVPVRSIPALGLPLGAALRLELHPTAPTAWRAVFTLCL